MIPVGQFRTALRAFLKADAGVAALVAYLESVGR